MSIELAGTSSTDADNLATAIFDQAPRYSFFRYTAKHDVSEQSPIIFIYTCPPSSKIKERMVYASSRAFVIAMAGHEAGIEITKKVNKDCGQLGVVLTVIYSWKLQTPRKLTRLLFMKSFTPK